MAIIGERLKNAWSAFKGRDPTSTTYVPVYSDTSKPDIHKLSRANGNTIAATIYNQIAVDCSSIDMKHVRLDDEDRFKETIDDSLNYLLTVSANKDQTGRVFIRDTVISMLDEGVIAIVPTVVDVDPTDTESFKVYEARVGKIVQWAPDRIRVDVYNDLIGKHQQIIMPKSCTPIVENPFYSIMNEPNSTMKRYSRLLSQLDRTNEDQAAGKIDLVIQLPYMTKSPAKIEQAENRRKSIEAQLTGNAQYGIAYIDGTEKVIQLNRSLENNLWTQAKEMQEEIFGQLGLSKAIFDGTADEKTMLNYNNRTIEPIMTAIAEEMDRKWISKTARTQKQAIRYFKNPFKLVPVNQIAEIADKFTRNEIMSSNEIRSVIGLKPSSDPKADELRNSNLNHPDEKEQVNVKGANEVEIQNQ